MKSLKILFYGELPPKTLHGVSISNQINLQILNEIGSVERVEEHSDIRVNAPFTHKSLRILKEILEVRRRASEVQPDLYYAVLSLSVPGGIKTFLAVLAVKLAAKPCRILIHIHRSDLKKVVDSSYFFKLLLSGMNRFTDLYLLLSKEQRRETASLFKNAEVLYNAIDEDEIYPVDRADRNRVQFLFLSNFIREKGFLDLIRTFAESPSLSKCRLLCYGSAPDHQLKKEAEAIQAVNQQISMSGPVYGMEKNRVLNEADILVLPSYNEGLPLVLLEGLRLGKPVVITRTGYIGEVLGEEYPLYCEAGNRKSIEGALLHAATLALDPAFRKLLQSYYEPFSMNMHKERLKELIHELTNPEIIAA